ncbi:MAG: winged helix-turn-helix domain-containing protein [Steroidobacter sp.]
MTSVSEESSPRAGDDLISFGPFQLNCTRYELCKDGVQIPAGSRAIAILLALTQSAGEILSCRELLRQVWQNTVVEEGTVRVHVALLRKALRDADPDNDYVQNVTGRGYRFVAPITRQGDSAHRRSVDTLHPSVVRLPVRQSLRKNNLPPRLTSIIGREPIIRVLAEKVPAQRFVTITGPGGGGKTTVAIGVANALAETYANGVCFVDLASITEARHVTNALASVLGVAPLAMDPLPNVLSCLSKQSLLLILDNCEHMIEATAKLAEHVLQSAPRVHVLATSREPLRAAGESVHELAPLEVLPEQCPQTRAKLLECPAVQLFVARAEAYADTEFDDDDLRRVCEICRRLEGNPLAIEITAAHVRLLGVRMLEVSLGDELVLSIDGRRTAELRHQSLRATFDWSHRLLSPIEQATFRRLSVFAGSFGLGCAAAVAADANLSDVGVFESLMSLARKSLVQADARGDTISYRLLDLPRAYAREKLIESGELETVRNRHAQMWCTLGAAQIQMLVRQGAEWVGVFGPRIEDLRAATRWSFSSASGSSLGTKLTLTSLWFEFVLAAESLGEPAWSELYGYILHGSEGALLSGLEDVLESSRGRDGATVRELTVLQQIAHGEPEHKIALWSLWFERVIKRDYRIAINLSKAARERGVRTSTPEAALMLRMLAVAYHYAGDQALACQHAQWALSTARSSSTTATIDALLRCHIRTILARSLWLRGFADQALEMAYQGVAEAERSGNRRMLCTTLLVVIVVTMWRGDTLAARQALDRLHEQSTAHSQEYHQLWAECLRVILETAPTEGQVIEPLRLSSDPLTTSQYLDFLGSVREDLVSTDAIVRAESGRSGWYTSEILRAKAERLIREGDSASISSAESLLLRSLEIARRQGALAWELRTAMSLARLWSEQERVSDARSLLSAVHESFTEGFDTADLKAARQLLKQLAPTRS